MKMFIVNMLLLLWLSGPLEVRAQSLAVLSGSSAKGVATKDNVAPQRSLSPVGNIGETANVTIYPGLVAGSDIRLHVADISGDISVQITNFQGRVLVGRRYKAGAYGHDFSLPTTYLNAGVYYLNMECNGVKKVQTIELTEE